MCIHTKTLGVCKNSLKRVHAFQKELEFGRVALVFEEKGKPEYPEKNLLEQEREATTNSNHIWRRCQGLNLGHCDWWEASALTTVRHPCSLEVAPHNNSMPNFPLFYHYYIFRSINNIERH